MIIQLVGSAMIVVGCAGVGFGLAVSYKREIGLLQQLIKLLNDMEWELQYRLTPLPELCRHAAVDSDGCIQSVFQRLNEELAAGRQPDVRTAMVSILDTMRLPGRIRKHLQYLGASLGRYDLHGQIQGLQTVKSACRKDLRELENGRTERLRGYQSLALCAGAAVAILLI